MYGINMCYRSSHPTVNKKVNTHSFQTLFSDGNLSSFTLCISLSHSAVRKFIPHCIMGKKLFEETQFFMIHIIKDILEKKTTTQFYIVFLLALETKRSRFYISYAFILCHCSETHLECFSLLTNVSVELLRVFAVSSQL